jgi:diguanylate cyclase (GGDEF)-like protein
MSLASVWTGEALEDSIADGNKETLESSPRPLGMAEEVGNAEAHMILDLPASSDYLLELIVYNLRQLGQAPHDAFLQKLLRDLTSVEVGEKESIVHWERILARRDELTEKLGRPVLLRTAAVDYFGELQLLRKPILLEYEELEKLRHNAATDPLTGLKNRRMFDEHLGREINRAKRYMNSFAMLLMDLRRFKLANDTYGHAVGDEILRSVARASIETMRGSDIACRIGGDEFALLLPQAERASAEALAERIARKFEAYAKPLAPATPVGIDCGIAIFPEDGEGATKLFQTADKNLYESKQKASRLPGESVVTAGGATPEVEGLEREVDAVRDAGALRRPAGADWLPGLGLAATDIQPSERPQSRRRYERIPVVGARRIGAIRLPEKSKFVKVLDVSLGGVGLLMDDYDVPESFPARIQAPFLPDAELILYRVYRRQLPDGKTRVGCSFTPLSQPGTA